jgi:hypothetical protein
MLHSPQPATAAAVPGIRTAPAWDSARGTPTEGQLEGFVREHARPEVVFPELVPVAHELGFGITTEHVEKVLVGSPDTWPSGASPEFSRNERLPHDARLEFLLKKLPNLAGSAKSPGPGIEEISVSDFHSDEAEFCRPSDVPLGHREAREFFRLARRVTSRELHDHYDFAPCYVTGPVRYGGRACTFQIRAGATGSITCDEESFDFACDACDALFPAR